MNALMWFQLATIALPKVTVGLTEFVSWMASLRRAAVQSGEWTPKYELQWREALLSRNLRPEEIPDAAV